MDEADRLPSLVESDSRAVTGDARPPEDDADGGGPALPDVVRRHLGRLLAAAYGEGRVEGDGADRAIDRFADLLARLDATPDGSGRRTAAEFQAELLAAVPALRRFAVSLIREPAAADDLVQDTVLRAWRSRGTFSLGTNLEAWAFTIMRNVFYSDRRKRAREVRDEDDAYAAKLAVVPEQGGHLDLQDVRAALDRLAPVMREALVLVAIQDLSYEQAAAVMGCAIGTVKSRVWRGREQLARMLGYTGAEVGTDALMSSAMVGAA